MYIEYSSNEFSASPRGARREIASAAASPHSFQTAKEPEKYRPNLIKITMPISKNKNALIVIDVQNYFVNEHTKNIPSRIASFIQKNKFDFIVFTKFVNHKNSNFFKLLNWKKCLRSPDTDIHPILEKFVNKSNVFEKAYYSVFKSNKLVKFLKKNNINNIFLCGIDIDACVLASAFDGFDSGYKIHILKDLSLSHSGKKLDTAALKIIKKNLGK